MATRDEVDRMLVTYEQGPGRSGAGRSHAGIPRDVGARAWNRPGRSRRPMATRGPGRGPEREWLIPGWLPVGRLGMLSGRGKSRLALQLAARMAAMPAARGPFVPAAGGPGNDTAVSDANLALDTTHAGTVVYASWEDEREEAGRRIAKFGADGLAVPRRPGRAAAVSRPARRGAAVGPARRGPNPGRGGRPVRGRPACAGHMRSTRRAGVGGGFAGRGLRR